MSPFHTCVLSALIGLSAGCAKAIGDPPAGSVPDGGAGGGGEGADAGDFGRELDAGGFNGDIDAGRYEPDAAPNAPDATPDATPLPIPDAAPDGAPEPDPDAAPQANPDAGAEPTTILLALDDAYVNSSAPNTTFDTEVLEIDGDPDELWALLKPRNLGGIPPGTTLLRATLIVTNLDDGNDYGVHELTGPWDEATVTFSNSPGLSPRLATSGGQIGVHAFDVTAVVQSWVNGAAANGLGLRMTRDNGVTLHSTESENAANRPQLLVELRGGGG